MAISGIPDGNCCASSIQHQLGRPSGTGPSSRYRFRLYDAADAGRIGQRTKYLYDAEQEIDGTTWKDILRIISQEGTYRLGGPEYLQVTHLILASEYERRPIRVFVHDENGGFYVQDYTEDALPDAPLCDCCSLANTTGPSHKLRIFRKAPMSTKSSHPLTYRELRESVTKPHLPLVETSSRRALDLQQSCVNPLQTEPRPRTGPVATPLPGPSARLPTAVFADESQLNEWDLRVDDLGVLNASDRRVRNLREEVMRLMEQHLRSSLSQALSEGKIPQGDLNSAR